MPRGIVRQADNGAVFRDDLGRYTAQGVQEQEEVPTVLHFSSTSKPRYILLPHWDPEEALAILHDHAAQMGHRLATPQVTPELMDMARQGGFTFHDHVGDGPTSGFMVSRRKNTEQMYPLDQLRPEHISQFVSKNARDLNQPNNYLGGWLDGKNFYLDVSTHRPTLDRAAHDAVAGQQLAIYNLNNDTTVNTPDAVWQSGDPGLALPEDHHQNLFTGARPRPIIQQEPAMPEHDWSQHGLGDPEHWEQSDPRHRQAGGPAALPPGLQYHAPLGGSTHGGQVWRNPANPDEQFIVKPTPSSSPFLAAGDVAASAIQQQSGLETPATFLTKGQNGEPASAQYSYPGATSAFPDGPINPDKISDADLVTIQKHHALDWMIGNHDAHERQWVHDKDGQLIGVDKGQAFKYFNHDRLDWNHHPNAMYGEHEPIYNTLYRSMAKGGRVLNDPRDGELGKYIQGLQSMPDQEYSDLLRPYAEQAAKVGQLGSFPNKYGGNPTPRFKPNDVEGFLAAAIARKNGLSADMGKLYDRAKAHAATGTKIASVLRSNGLLPRLAAAPDPSVMKSMHQQLGTHGARLFSDPQGQWLVKRPPKGADFMVPMDAAAAELQERVGLPAPETHTIPWHQGEATAVAMLPGATQAWQKPPELADTHPADVLALQKHQALNWLISNHDGHAGNFMRTPDGGLVGLDKAQAGKYYGRDRLSNDFHPNYYAREPVINNLWRNFADGHPGEMNDPRKGELGEFVKSLHDIPDHELKQMFRPYAESAARAGLLANVADDDPKRNLGPATIPPNDPEAFLHAMVKRKRSLADDLGKHYDDNVAQRAAAQHAGLKMWL